MLNYSVHFELFFAGLEESRLVSHAFFWIQRYICVSCLLFSTSVAICQYLDLFSILGSRLIICGSHHFSAIPVDDPLLSLFKYMLDHKQGAKRVSIQQTISGH